MNATGIEAIFLAEVTHRPEADAPAVLRFPARL
jgi:hypothetical protein